jgi:hypothetical protein
LIKKWFQATVHGTINSREPFTKRHAAHELRDPLSVKVHEHRSLFGWRKKPGKVAMGFFAEVLINLTIGFGQPK